MISKKTGAEITLNIQYIKNIHFKNTQAPQVYTFQNLKPNISVSLDLNAIKIQKDIYEIEIIINTNAKYNEGEEEKELFKLEINYCGIFAIKNVPETLIAENLFVDCPTMLFPFVRRILSDTTRDANLPPLSLDLVDFEEMYNSKKNTLANIKINNEINKDASVNQI